MENTIPDSKETCVAPGMAHNLEFKIAAFGQHTFQCTICGLYFDEPEDSNP